MSTETRVGYERQEYLDQGYPKFPVKYQGETFTCFVLPQSICPKLPHFVRHQVADDRTQIRTPDETSVFGVSDSIPIDFRQFVVIHEIVEYWIGKSCGQSTRREIEVMRASGLTLVEQSQYIAMRCEFFEGFIGFAKKYGYPPIKIAEFKTSLEIFKNTSSI